MEMYQQRINTPNNFPSIPPSLQQMLRPDRASSPMVQCGSTLVYLSSHSFTSLEWMQKLDVSAQNCVYACVGGVRH